MRQPVQAGDKKPRNERRIQHQHARLGTSPLKAPPEVCTAVTQERKGLFPSTLKACLAWRPNEEEGNHNAGDS